MLGHGPGGTIAWKWPSAFWVKVAQGFSPGFRAFGSATLQLILPVWLEGLVNSTWSGSMAVLVNASRSVEAIVRSAGSIRGAPRVMVFWAPPCMPALGVGAGACVEHPARAPVASRPIVANTHRAIAPPVRCVCGWALWPARLRVVNRAGNAGLPAPGLRPPDPSSPDLHLTLSPAR